MEVSAGGLRARYDLIVIGAGPAGLTLARKYEERTGNKVLMIESGPRSVTGESHAQQLALTQATGDLDPTHYARHSRRNFGGTSTVWAGYCAVLEERPFLNNEWPLSYDELYGYYPEAAKILELPEKVYTRPEVAFPDNSNIVYRPYYLSTPTRFNESFNRWLNHNVNVDRALQSHGGQDQDKWMRLHQASRYVNRPRMGPRSWRHLETPLCSPPVAFRILVC